MPRQPGTHKIVSKEHLEALAEFRKNHPKLKSSCKIQHFKPSKVANLENYLPVDDFTHPVFPLILLQKDGSFVFPLVPSTAVEMTKLFIILCIIDYMLLQNDGKVPKTTSKLTTIINSKFAVNATGEVNRLKKEDFDNMENVIKLYKAGDTTAANKLFKEKYKHDVTSCRPPVLRLVKGTGTVQDKFYTSGHVPAAMSSAAATSPAKKSAASATAMSSAAAASPAKKSAASATTAAATGSESTLQIFTTILKSQSETQATLAKAQAELFKKHAETQAENQTLLKKHAETHTALAEVQAEHQTLLKSLEETQATLADCHLNLLQRQDAVEDRQEALSYSHKKLDYAFRAEQARTAEKEKKTEKVLRQITAMLKNYKSVEKNLALSDDCSVARDEMFDAITPLRTRVKTHRGDSSRGSSRSHSSRRSHSSLPPPVFDLLSVKTPAPEL